MQKHFNFAHTIVPEEQQESSENLLNLFQIGGQGINLQHNRRQEEDDSDQTVKEKKIKKEKKEQKHKQKKEHKHKDKKDKEKKQKKHKKHKGKSPSRESDQFLNQPIQVYHPRQKLELYQKYSKIYIDEGVDEMLSHKFELNIKLGEGLLNVDVIKFPEHRLFQYGPMDKQIPRYQRLNYDQIIGFEGRQGKKIIKKLNHIINQKNINPNQDQISSNRYFHYQGYEQVGLQSLAFQKALVTSSFLLRFTQQSQSISEQQQMLKMTKEMNRQINQDPKNIDLWVQFIRLQDTFSMSVGSLKNKAAVIDRKISILQKALNFNKFNEQLGMIFLGLLFERQHDHKQLSKKCLQFIKANPSSKSLWKFYFNLRIEQFNIFSHPQIRIMFEEISKQFKTIIDKTKSALQIWSIRKASLQILKSMLHSYKLQGYGELSTGLIVGLIEFNLFMPDEAVKVTGMEEKLQLFYKYWEDYQTYKLGQTMKSSWAHIVPYSQLQTSFIGHYPIPKQKEGNPIMEQMRQTERIWRMSNARHDQLTIQRYPQSFIFYQDIDFGLMLYRDNQSLSTLIDILADHLELPPLFCTTNIYSQFTFKIVENRLRRMVRSNDFQSQYLTCQNQSYWWSKFWNPNHTQIFVPPHNMLKIQYLRRILIAAKQRMATHRSVINQYLAFIACCIELSAKMREMLKVSEGVPMQYLREILKEEPLNLGVWCIYIESTYIKRKNHQQCINCFLQLFQTVKLLIPTQSQTQTNIQILYWLSQFSRIHQISISQFIINKYKQLSFAQVDQTIDLNTKLNSFDCLLVEQQLGRQVNKVLSQQGVEQVGINRYKAILFLLFYSQQYPHSSLTSFKQNITTFLIQQVKRLTLPNQRLFLLRLLTQYKLLTQQHISSNDLFKIIPHIALVQYWVSLSSKPFILFQQSFQALPYKNLVMWMISCVFVSRKSITHQHLYEYLVSYSKKSCFEDSLNDQHPSYITLLNQLLIYDVNQSHSKFIAYSLHHLPFSKSLYLLNALCSENENERRKISTLIHEKSIRILNPSLLAH